MRTSSVHDAVVSLLLLTVMACAQPSPDQTQAKGEASEVAAHSERGCVDPSELEAGADLYPQKLEPRWASGFTISYHGHYKLLEIQNAGQSWKWALVRCGAPTPELDPAVSIVEVPVRRVATTSTTDLPHLESLGLMHAWVGHADLRYVSSRQLRVLIDEGTVAEIGGADGLGLDIERLIGLAPDLLFADNPNRAGADRLQLLEQVGTRVVPMPSFLESSPLARAEWLKVTALFFDREVEAQQVFQEIESGYEQLRRRVMEATGDGADQAARPTVITGAPWQGVWHVAGGDSFMAKLLADAGADYLWADSPGVGPLLLDIERVYEKASDADFWFNPSHLGSLREIEAADQRLAAFDAFQQQRVYAPDLRLQPSGGNDYWELGVHRPDLVLSDLVAVLHPQLLPDAEMVFHRRLEVEAP